MAEIRIFGDRAKLRAYLVKKIKDGEALLDRAVDVAQRLAAADEGSTGLAHSLNTFVAREPWTKDYDTWRFSAARTLQKYLGAELKAVLPEMFAGNPPGTRADDFNEEREALVVQLQGLRSLLDQVGTTRGVAAVASGPRLDELRAAGLVEDKMLEIYEHSMGRTAGQRQIMGSISASKELVEATLRGALDRLGVDWDKHDDLPKLMKKWRRAVSGEPAAMSKAGRGVIDRAQASLAAVVAFSAEARNEMGSGHGRTKIPPGVEARHARLAADSAEALVRFIATTLDDLGRLAP